MKVLVSAAGLGRLHAAFLVPDLRILGVDPGGVTVLVEDQHTACDGGVVCKAIRARLK